MNKIRILFLSVQPSMIAALMSFFFQDPLLALDFDDLNNFDAADKNKHLKKYEVVVFDDGALNAGEYNFMKEDLIENSGYKKILYTHSTDKDYLISFACAGVDGIISKRAGSEIIKEGIIKVASGEKYFCKNVSGILSGGEEKINSGGLVMLTPREREILMLMKEGLTNKEIAARLFRSVKTVACNKENIKNKFGLKHINEIFKILK